MRADLFQIVTFAKDPRRGNPAFVVRDVGAASENALAGLCDALRTDVIAVIGDGATGAPALRFFTSEGAHPGAGHATLAAAHVVLREAANAPDHVTFHLANGEKRVAQTAGNRIAIGFPSMLAERTNRVGELRAALGVRPIEAWISSFGYVAVFKDAQAIANMRPDMDRIAALDRSAVIVTAPASTSSDIVIRVFAPAAGLPEDPVCGTAHRIIVPYWAERLGKRALHSRQLSPRGGDLWCEASNGMVIIAGESCRLSTGTVQVPEA